MLATGLVAARLMTIPQMALAVTLCSGIESLTVWDVHAYSWFINVLHFLLLQTLGESAYLFGVFFLFWKRGEA